MTRAPLDMNSADFPIVQQMRNAVGEQALAALLLRISDEIAVTFGEELREACAEAGFVEGCNYLATRAAAVSAVRDSAGQLPGPLLAAVERGRLVMAEIAMGLL